MTEPDTHTEGGVRAAVRASEAESESQTAVGDLRGRTRCGFFAPLQREKAEIWLRGRAAAPRFRLLLLASFGSTSRNFFSVRDLRGASSSRHVERARRFRERVAAVVAALTGLKKCKRDFLTGSLMTRSVRRNSSGTRWICRLRGGTETPSEGVHARKVAGKTWRL